MSTKDPQNTQEHLERIDALSKYNISHGQTALVALTGAVDAALGGAAVAGYSTIHVLRNNLKDIQRNGDEVIKFELKAKNVWDAVATAAKERPKIMSGLLAGAAAFAITDAYSTYLHYKRKNNAAIGESVRAVRKEAATSAPEDQTKLGRQVLGVWTDKVVQADTAPENAINR